MEATSNQDHGASRADCHQHATDPLEATAQPTSSRLGPITSRVHDPRDRQRRSLREATVHVAATCMPAVRRCCCRPLAACAIQAVHPLVCPCAAGACLSSMHFARYAPCVNLCNTPPSTHCAPERVLKPRSWHIIAVDMQLLYMLGRLGQMTPSGCTVCGSSRVYLATCYTATLCFSFSNDHHLWHAGTLHVVVHEAKDLPAPPIFGVIRFTRGVGQPQSVQARLHTRCVARPLTSKHRGCARRASHLSRGKVLGAVLPG
jgi:hypothetical protein